MKKYTIWNLNLNVAEVIATDEKDALEKYCNSRNVYNRSNYRATLNAF